MWPYWSLFLLFAFLATSRSQPIASPGEGAGLQRSWVAVFFLLVTMIGLRYQVGGDWGNYINQLDRTPNSLREAIVVGDPAYAVLNWIAVQSDQGVYFVNSVSAVLFTWGLLAFCRAQPNAWLALVVAVPYLVTVVAMGYTRQAVAIGLTMLGLAGLDRGRVLRLVVCLAAAATFHKSAVILMPLAILVGARRRFYVMVLVGLATFLLFTFLLRESVEDLRTNYIDAAYGSRGAAIRIWMNAVPALFFLASRRRFQVMPAERTFWTWMAVIALGFLVLLQVSPSSTAVDRVALYWIPLQLFVWSRLPGATERSGGENRATVIAVVGYSGAVLFAWFSMADNALYWLPYQFYPLID